jgi:hypothetical protein
MKFKITLFNKEKQPTFNDTITLKNCNDTTDYTIIMQEIIKELKFLNIDVSTEVLTLIILGGRLLNESSILIERE